MRIFDHFPKNSVCPICGTNEDKKAVLVSIAGTYEDGIYEANAYHLDCIELFELEDGIWKQLKTKPFQIQEPPCQS